MSLTDIDVYEDPILKLAQDPGLNKEKEKNKRINKYNTWFSINRTESIQAMPIIINDPTKLREDRIKFKELGISFVRY